MSSLLLFREKKYGTLATVVTRSCSGAGTLCSGGDGRLVAWNLGIRWSQIASWLIRGCVRCLTLLGSVGILLRRNNTGIFPRALALSPILLGNRHFAEIEYANIWYVSRIREVVNICQLIEIVNSLGTVTLYIYRYDFSSEHGIPISIFLLIA